MRVKHCFAPNCSSNNESEPGTTFHSLPSNERILAQWAKNMNREEKILKAPKSTQKHYFVCGKHFVDSCFQTYERKKLNRGAIPTIFSIPKEKKLLPNLKITNIYKRNDSKPLILNHQIVFPNLFESIEEASQRILPEISPAPGQIDLAQDGMDSDRIAQSKITVELPELNPVHSNTGCVKKKQPPEDPAKPQDSVEVLMSNLFNDSKSKADKQYGKFRDKRTRAKIKPSKRHTNRLLQSAKKTVLALEKCKGCCMNLFNNKRTTIFNNKVIHNLGKLSNMPAAVKRYMSQQLKTSRRHNSPKYKKREIPFYAALYHHSKTAYHYLSLVFKLPSPRTLNLFLKSTKFESGLNLVLLDHLKKRLRLGSLLDKYCILLFKEVKIRPSLSYNGETDTTEGLQVIGGERTTNIVSRCFVFVLSGLNSEWKQPIAYYLVSNRADSLSDCIHEVISQVHARTDLAVVASVSDLSATNIGALYSLMDLVDSDDFTYKINGRQVVHVFDPSDLLNQLQNHFVGHTVVYDGRREANWEHLAELFDLKQVSQVPQVFDISLANSLKATSDRYADTADFCTFVSDLFDSLTTGAKIDGSSAGFKLWAHAATRFASLKFVNATSERTSSSSSFVARTFSLSICNLLKTWSTLKTHGFPCFTPKLLNLYPLDDFLAVVRHFSGKHPTSIQFQESFKISLFSDKFTHSQLFVCPLLPETFYVVKPPGSSTRLFSTVLYKVVQTVDCYSAGNIAKFLIRNVLHRNCEPCLNVFCEDSGRLIARQKLVAQVDVLQREVYQKITDYLSSEQFVKMLYCFAEELWALDLVCPRHKHEMKYKCVGSVCFIMVNCFIKITNKMLRKQFTLK